VAPGEAEKGGGGGSERDGEREVRALVEPRQLGQLVVAPLVDHLAEEGVRNVVGGRRALGDGRLGLTRGRRRACRARRRAA